MKIHPTLRCSDARDAKCHPAMCECVAARLRALESVARAAARWVNLPKDQYPEPRIERALSNSVARLAKIPKEVK